MGVLIRDDGQSLQKSETGQLGSQTEEKPSRCKMFFTNLYHFFKAPVVVFSYSVVGCFVFT